MKIVLVQQFVSDDRGVDTSRGLDAVRTATTNGVQLVCFAELAFGPSSLPFRHAHRNGS